MNTDDNKNIEKTNTSIPLCNICRNCPFNTKEHICKNTDDYCFMENYDM